MAEINNLKPTDFNEDLARELYPDVYEKVRNEIDEFVDKVEDVEYDVLKNKLTYCSAFLNEVLRHYPPLAAIVLR